MSARQIRVLAMLALLGCRPALAQAPPPLPPLSQLPLVADIKDTDAAGPWGMINLDTTTHRAFVGRAGGVWVIDLQSDQTLPDIMDGAHVHAALPLPLGRLLVTDGQAGTATVLDQATGQVRQVIRGLSDPGAAIIEPATGDVLVVESGSGRIAMIDTQSGHIVSRIAVGGRLKMVQADGTGRVWVTVQDRNQVALVDLPSRRVVGRYPLAGCRQPTGLADVTVINRLVIACRNGIAKVLTGTDGRDIGTVPIGMRAAGVMIATSQAWIAAADGTLSVVSLRSTPKLVARYQSRPGARTGAFDPFSRRFYLPYGAVSGGRLVAGSFGVLVLQGQ